MPGRLRVNLTESHAPMYRERLVLFVEVRSLLKGIRVLRVGIAAAVICSALLSVAVSLPARAQAPQYHAPVVAPNDTLNDVKYDYRWELYGGVAYSHFDAGPQLLQGANLGGFNVQASRFLTHRWAAMADVRGYYGTSGAQPNPYGIIGPFVSEHMFLVGPQYRGPSNQHVSMTLHALFGGAYGDFQRALYDQNNHPVPPLAVGFFSNQLTWGSAIGGSIDLNRSPRLSFRISPDATLVNFGGYQVKEQFALSVGLVYRLGKIGAPHKPKKR
ncbi:hypothetical protein C7378_0399 [Acidipila rosea]|uniref:Opacity protein-like surface antigen n=1 Tax=Acidipila rosea TaxID=768535 RepID=A0A4R1LAF6_9BACT|nr:hypothetical protein C7378_0399 [Acidipila rosea]